MLFRVNVDRFVPNNVAKPLMSRERNIKSGAVSDSTFIDGVGVLNINGERAQIGCVTCIHLQHILGEEQQTLDVVGRGHELGQSFGSRVVTGGRSGKTWTERWMVKSQLCLSCPESRRTAHPCQKGQSAVNARCWEPQRAAASSTVRAPDPVEAPRPPFCCFQGGSPYDHNI